METPYRTKRSILFYGCFLSFCLSLYLSFSLSFFLSLSFFQWRLFYGLIVLDKVQHFKQKEQFVFTYILYFRTPLPHPLSPPPPTNQKHPKIKGFGSILSIPFLCIIRKFRIVYMEG